MSKKRLSIKKRKTPSEVTIGLLALGLMLILLSSLIWLSYPQSVLSFNGDFQQTTSSSINPPVFIEIPERDIHVSVTESFISKGVWQISDQGASHLAFSATADQNNNIVIYGHNKKQIFGPLLAAKPDDQITLTTKDGQKHQYVVTSIFKVNPNQIEVVKPTNSEILTIYTCTGFADSERFVVQAKPIRV
jgi:LPXTG-site transpeptidase (sortase) family protein